MLPCRAEKLKGALQQGSEQGREEHGRQNERYRDGETEGERKFRCKREQR